MNVLVVEDDLKITKESVEDTLCALGHDHVWVDNVQDARKQLQRQQFDCILLDLEIPLGRHTRYETRAAWESGAPTAAGVKGTVNNSKDNDECFRLVMAIPWKALKFGGNSPPKGGEAWKFIVARCDLSKRYGGKQELSTCVPLPTIDFHPRPQYPTMIFAD